jgi:hypothetical protein
MRWFILEVGVRRRLPCTVHRVKDAVAIGAFSR